MDKERDRALFIPIYYVLFYMVLKAERDQSLRRLSLAVSVEIMDTESVRMKSWGRGCGFGFRGASFQVLILLLLLPDCVRVRVLDWKNMAALPGNEKEN